MVIHYCRRILDAERQYLPPCDDLVCVLLILVV